MDIGLNPAARAMGIREGRARKWAHRANLKVGPSKTLQNCDLPAELEPNGTALKAKSRILAQMGDRTRLAMGRTSMRAFEHADTVPDAELHKLQTAIALEKHGKNAGMAFQWSAAAANVAVQVNVPMPTAAERDEMRRLDDKLDAIAAKLQS